jgi:hypothetical protein
VVFKFQRNAKGKNAKVGDAAAAFEGQPLILKCKIVISSNVNAKNNNPHVVVDPCKVQPRCGEEDNILECQI